MTTNYPKVQGPAQPIWQPYQADVALGSNSQTNPVYTAFPVSSYDSFGRIRVSNPQTLFESTHVLSNNPLFWESVLTAGGTATHQAARASMALAVTGTSGDKVVRQSRRYIRYQPGKSQQILTTFVLGAGATGVRRRVGYFDANNGIFLEQTVDGLFMVLRSNVSGSVVDTRVAQADWNLNPNLSIDATKAQIFYIDLEWLGVGSVRIGFVREGMVFYTHQFKNANVASSVYMATGHLPVRYEIENTSAGAGVASLEQICSSVNSEGGREEQNLVFSILNTASRVVANTPLPVMSIQVATVFPAGGSLVNRETVYPISASLYTEDDAIAFWFVYNGTLTNPSWQNVNTTHSGIQYDVSATAITGGVQIGDTGFLSATNQSRNAILSHLESDLAMALNVAGTQGDILSLVCQRLTATSSDTWAGLSWQELY